jgi:hypothetical protein
MPAERSADGASLYGRNAELLRVVGSTFGVAAHFRVERCGN